MTWTWGNWLQPHASSSPLPWDTGLTVSIRRTGDPPDLPFDVDYVRDSVLKVAGGSIEDEHITNLIRGAVDLVEGWMQTALMPQEWTLTLDKFPASGWIELWPPPLIAVTSIGYVDAEGTPQTLAGSPADYQVLSSSQTQRLPTAARLFPLTGASWPTTNGAIEAVTIVFEAGYPLTSDSPAEVTVPQNYLNGVLAVVAETYKQRSLSVQGQGWLNTASVLDLNRFCPRRWA